MKTILQVGVEECSFTVGAQDLFPIRAIAIAARRLWFSTFSRSCGALSSGRVDS